MLFLGEVGISNKVSSPGISCIVLAGGKSVRLGRDKALEPFCISNLLEIVLSRLSLFKSEIILVTAAGDKYEQLCGFTRVRTVVDMYPDTGPMGGIITGLSVSSTFYNLIVACDMPFLNNDLLQYMIQLSANNDVVVPRKGSYFEPLHGVYSRNCLQPLLKLLNRGELQVYKLFPLVKVRYVSDDEVVQFDPRRLSFFNINTEADLMEARELLKTNSR